MGEAIDPGTVEALYAEPPDRFIAARKELAGRLKEAGDADGAAAVAALRKPTVAAWAVDRLARDHRADLDALIEAGRQVATAQRRAGTSGGAQQLQEASAERRRLVERLVRAAATSLESGGMSAARASLDKVSDTLLAIATDEEAAERVRRGVLDKELAAPAGFGDQTLDASLLASVTELPRRADRDEARPTVGERRQAEARRKADRLADEAGRLEDEADELDRAAIDAEKQAATSRRAADAARKKAETARRRADDAAKRV
jgi:hypothetical protein